jgi:Holliday junction resolvasome RuvABC endonuclease subunit
VGDADQFARRSVILAVDPGYGKCGWAIVQPRTARVVDLGVWTSEKDPGLDKSTDRARRVHALSLVLVGLHRQHGCTVIAGEGALSHGTVHAVIPQAMVWGGLSMLAACSGSDLVEVLAKQWQHAILPDADKITYAQVERALSRHIGHRLAHVAESLHNHALDAVGVGLYTALRKVTRVVQRTSAFHGEQQQGDAR